MENRLRYCVIYGYLDFGLAERRSAALHTP